eukprot:scaffold11836_cov119-Isochrysis_galbana.AAC.2
MYRSPAPSDGRPCRLPIGLLLTGLSEEVAVLRVAARVDLRTISLPARGAAPPRRATSRAAPHLTRPGLVRSKIPLASAPLFGRSPARDVGAVDPGPGLELVRPAPRAARLRRGALRPRAASRAPRSGPGGRAAAAAAAQPDGARAGGPAARAWSVSIGGPVAPRGRPVADARGSAVRDGVAARARGRAARPGLVACPEWHCRRGGVGGARAAVRDGRRRGVRAARVRRARGGPAWRGVDASECGAPIGRSVRRNRRDGEPAQGHG